MKTSNVEVWVCFTAEGVEIKREKLQEISYLIFGEKNDTFAKES